LEGILRDLRRRAHGAPPHRNLVKLARDDKPRGEALEIQGTVAGCHGGLLENPRFLVKMAGFLLNKEKYEVVGPREMWGMTNRHDAGGLSAKSEFRSGLPGGAQPDMAVAIPVIVTNHGPAPEKTFGRPARPVRTIGAETPLPPILDDTILERLREDTTTSGFSRLIDTAVRETGERARRVEHVSGKANLDTLDFEAHALLSMSDIFGLPRLKDHAMRLIAACKSGDTKRAVRLARTLYPLAATSLVALNNWKQ